MDTRDSVVKRIPTRFRAPIVIASGVLLQFTFGIVYTFGNILPYLVSYMRWKVNPQQSTGSLIWLQSLMAGIPLAMLAGGYLEKHIGARRGAFIGSFLYTGSLALCYFTVQTSFISLLVTLGLLSSFGQGIGYNCVLIQCQKWLPNRVGLVSGLITAGYGLSAFAIAPLQTKYINPENLKVNTQGYFTQTELLERVPKMFVVLASLFAVLQLIALVFVAEPEGGTQNEDGEQMIPLLDEEGDDEGNDATLPITRSTSSQTLTHSQVLSSPTFAILFFTLMLNATWVQIIAGLYKAYGQTFITDDFFLATVNSFAAAMNCVSRILWGIFADKTSYQTSMSVNCAAGAFLMWTLGLVQLIAQPMLFFLWISLMFCCIGGTYSLIPYAVHRCFGGENFGIAFGFLQLSMTFAGVISALSSQFLLPIIGFQVLFTLTGCTMLISFLMTIFIHTTKHGSIPTEVIG